MTPEGKIKKQVKELLVNYSHYHFMPVQSGYGRRTLDFLVCFNGLFVAIETKAPGEKLTVQQEKIKDEINAAGGVVIVVDGEFGLSFLRDWFESRKDKHT